jgi:enoyl-CoA hydratase/carnithine racemase
MANYFANLKLELIVSPNPASAYEDIIVQHEGSVAIITLNRPDKLNSLNDQILYDLQRAMDELEQVKSVRAVILTGSGRAFCAGFDISPRKQPLKTVEHWREHVTLGNDTCFKIWRSRLPVVAAVNGFCLGGGCDLSMACDLTLSSEAAEFGEPEIQVQSAPPFAIMPWVVSMKHAKELLLTGGRINAHEAARIGLVNRVVAAAQLMTEARKLAIQLAKVPADTMMFNKRAINRGYEIRGFLDAIDYGAEIFTLIKMSESSEEQKEFMRVAAEQGLKAAFKWRDQKFALDNDAEA